MKDSTDSSQASREENREPERCLAVYDGEHLILVILQKPGPVYGAHLDGRPLLTHDRISGKIVLAEYHKPLLSVLKTGRSPEKIHSILSEKGYRILKTPVSALKWILYQF